MTTGGIAGDFCGEKFNVALECISIGQRDRRCCTFTHCRTCTHCCLLAGTAEGPILFTRGANVKCEYPSTGNILLVEPARVMLSKWHLDRFSCFEQPLMTVVHSPIAANVHSQNYVFWAQANLSCKQHLVWSSGVEKVNVRHRAKFHEDRSKHCRDTAI